MKTMLISAFAYKQWADLRAIDAAEAIDTTMFSTQADFIRQQLNHMILVEENFRARLIGERIPNPITNTPELSTLKSLNERLQRSNTWFQRYLADIDSDEINDIIAFDFVDHQRGSMSKAEVLFHIINHGTYHRGAIGKALDLAGGLRPADTYTVFIHQAEPERRSR